MRGGIGTEQPVRRRGPMAMPLVSREEARYSARLFFFAVVLCGSRIQPAF